MAIATLLHSEHIQGRQQLTSPTLAAEKDNSLFALVEVVFFFFLNLRDSMHYLDKAIVIVLKTKRTHFVTPSVNSTSFVRFGQNMLSKSELLSFCQSEAHL